MNRQEAFTRLVDKGWTGDLLSIIPPGVKLATGSSIPETALGKVPGRPYADGTWGGIARWETLRATEIDIQRWLKTECSIGIICRCLRVVDVDCDNPELVAAIRALIAKRLGKTVWRGRSGTPRGALFYRAEPAIGSKQKLVWNGGKIEILGYGNQIVIWGAHSAGGHYEWQDGSLFDHSVQDLPLLAEADIALLFDAIAALLHDYGIASHKPSVHGGTIRRAGVHRPLGNVDLVAKDKDQAVRALWAIPNEPLLPDGTSNTWAEDYDHIIAISAAFMGAVGGEQRYVDELIRWLHKWPKNTEEWIAEKIESFRRGGTEIGAEALFHCAKSWNFTEVPVGTFQPIKLPDASGEVVDLKGVRKQAGDLVQGASQTILPASSHVGNPFTDQQLAIDCWHQSQLNRTLRYDASGRWMLWNGNRWVADTILADRATDLIRKIIGEITKHLPEGNPSFRLAFRLEAEERARRVLSILRSYAGVTRWDADPYTLNTPRGMVNLKTGDWRPTKPSDHVRSITPVVPEDDPPEVWLRATKAIFDDSLQLQQLWIDWLAICLLAERLRDIAVILRGSGRNGKSLLLHSAAAMLGDIREGGYAFITAEPDCFDIRSKKKSDTGSLGLLDGVRLAMFTETPAGFRCNEALWKAAIAGEKVEAKFLYHPVFIFRFTAALAVCTNTSIDFTSSMPALRNRHFVFDLVRQFLDDKKFFDAVVADAPRLLGLCIRRCTEILQGAETFFLPTSWGKRRDLYQKISMRSAEHFDLQDPIPSLLRRLIERRRDAYIASRDVPGRLRMALRTVADSYDQEMPKIEEALAMTERSLNMSIARAMIQEFGVRSSKYGHDQARNYRGVAWQINPVLPFADREDNE